VAQPLFIIEFLNFCGLPGETSHVCVAVGVHFVSLFLWLLFYFHENSNWQCNAVFAFALFYGESRLPWTFIL